MKYKITTRCSQIGLIFLTLLLLLSGGITQAAQPAPPLTEGEKSLATQINYLFRRAVEQVSPAVVSLQVYTEGPGYTVRLIEGLGSGCIIDPRGYIITNNHVVADTDKIEVFLADGRRFIAKENMVAVGMPCFRDNPESSVSPFSGSPPCAGKNSPLSQSPETTLRSDRRGS